MNWKDYLEKYQKELEQSVIPFWEQHCVDKKYGGYFTFLDREGTVFDTNKFMWMQWRIVYQFASLYNKLEKKESWLEIAKQGYEFLTKNGHDPSNNNNYYFCLDQKGKPMVASYNIFSEAFAMMGCAELYQATKEEQYRLEANASMNRYLARMDNPKGKWEKSIKTNKPRLNLGHYMILANMGLISKEILKISDYNELIKKAVEMVQKRFYNPQYHIIFENINKNYSFDLESTIGRQINPGHGLEACWFLLNYLEKFGNRNIIPDICRIIKEQLAFGWDKKFGGIFYFMDVLGKPHLELSWDMKLWWVHNEALNATLTAYRLSRDKELLQWFTKIDEWTWKHFPDPEYGEWFGYLNRYGKPTHYLKGGKWKAFFHLPRCLYECSEQIKLLMKS